VRKCESVEKCEAAWGSVKKCKEVWGRVRSGES